MANPFLVLGGVAVGIVTAGFGILQVPGWVAAAQDAAAQNDIAQVTIAQAAANNQIGHALPSLDAINAEPDLGLRVTPSNGVELCIDASAKHHVVAARSASGTFFARVDGADIGKGSTPAAAVADAGGLDGTGLSVPDCAPGAPGGDASARGAAGPDVVYAHSLISRLNSFSIDATSSETAGDFRAANGDLICGPGTTFPRNVYLGGDLQLDFGCSIQGDAIVGGTVRQSGGTITGAVRTPSTEDHINGWVDVDFKAQDWVTAGYLVETVTGSDCSLWAGTGEDISSLTAVGTPTVYDIRSCAGGLSTAATGANRTITLGTDVAVITDGWTLSGAQIQSADGTAHTLHLITPDGSPSIAGPQVGSAQRSEIRNGTNVDGLIAVRIYTPGTVTLNDAGGRFRGQIDAGSLSVGGGARMAFAPRAIPGVDFGAAR